jgi:hypothetical protein
MTEEVVIVETPRGDPVNHVEPGEPDGPEVGFWEISAHNVNRVCFHLSNAYNPNRFLFA